ncbi:MAG: HAD family hydrolase [Verrucomicrobia bacterium]|nr:HAD family hydrolase [Verrucomicrobiota bacterium]
MPEGTRFIYRLAAIDLDGTLLGPDKTISPENRAAVDRLHKRGVKIIIASGRRHQNSIRFQRELDLTGPIIACQGGLIRDGITGQIVESHLLSEKLASEIVDLAESKSIPAIYYHLDHLFVSQMRNEWIDLYESRVGEKAEILPTLHELHGSEALKIVWYDNPPLLQSVRPNLTAKYKGQLDILSTEAENLEFMPLGISKASALAKVAATFSISPEETMAFGDGENDVPMLHWAGLGVAMNHGNPLAKAASKIVSPEGAPETAFARAVEVILR